MGITIDALTKSTSATFQHVCSGDDGLLIVMAAFVPDNEQETVSMKYNGRDLVFDYLQGGLGLNLAVGYLVAPDTGSHDVEVSITGSPPCLCMAFSLNGVKQTNPVWDFRSAVGHLVKDLPIHVHLREGAMTLGLGMTNDITADIDQTYGTQVLEFNETGNEMRAIGISAIGTQEEEMLLPNKLTKSADWGIFILGIDPS
jgi:hypothetical protein